MSNSIDLIKEKFPKVYRDYWGSIAGMVEGRVEHHNPLYNGRHTHCRSFLYTLVKILRPKNIVEFGTWYGESCKAMSRCMKDNNINGSIITFDIIPGGYSEEKIEDIDNTKRMYWYPYNGPWDAYKYNNPRIVYKDFMNISNEDIFNKNCSILHDVAPKDGFDLIIIDGDHSLSGIEYDWKIAKKFSNKNTVIVIDDLLENRIPDVKTFWDRITNDKYDFKDWNDNLANDLISDGVCLI